MAATARNPARFSRFYPEHTHTLTHNSHTLTQFKEPSSTKANYNMEMDDSMPADSLTGVVDREDENSLGIKSQHLKFFIDFSSHQLVPIELIDSISEENIADSRMRKVKKMRELDGDIGIGAYDHGDSTITEKSLPNEGVQMGVRGSTESDGGDFEADDEDASTGIILGEILGQAEDGAAGEAALLVHHEPLDGGAEAEELGELAVGAGYVDARGGAEDEVSDLGLGLAPLLDGLGGDFLIELGDFDDHHALTGVEGWGHVEREIIDYCFAGDGMSSEDGRILFTEKKNVRMFHVSPAFCTDRYVYRYISFDAMGFFANSAAMCPKDHQHCSQWAQKYMDYCLCGTKDGVSLGLGLISVISWGVAEIPQIITNYKENSAEGLSIAFLMTWILGDLLNVFGCMLEPATLPTQYYMALEAVDKQRQHSDPGKKQFGNSDGLENGRKAVASGFASTSPIPLPALSHNGSLERELYYTSARSLSRSHTPTVGFHVQRRSTSVYEQNPSQEPLLGAHESSQSAPPSKAKTMLCVVSSFTFFLGACNLQLERSNKTDMVFHNPNRGVMVQVGRKLLQVSGSLLQETGNKENGGIGTFLGWGMAAIYMGGRLPQICLNIRRGNVEGLNPLMFVFALVGNATYVARFELSWHSCLISLLRCLSLKSCAAFAGADKPSYTPFTETIMPRGKK
ncbi:hypothetical protein RJ640_016647 [Escallonia rubra]|uniref:Uncharacterized protein n=1 Tax=Escallonia rubra TaxID=112253 RepID=A0AA88QUF3_9ASTE|nr:hypothetical protein RJ640_016647 [Escallonia rubra]